jgi:hypothetical protein
VIKITFWAKSGCYVSEKRFDKRLFVHWGVLCLVFIRWMSLSVDHPLIIVNGTKDPVPEHLASVLDPVSPFGSHHLAF